MKNVWFLDHLTWITGVLRQIPLNKGENEEKELQKMM